MRFPKMELTRRHALFAGAGAAAAPLVGGMSMARAQGAQGDTEKPAVARPTHYRFPIGEFEVNLLLDGARQLDGPHPIFGQDQPPEEVAAYAEERFLPGDRMEISFAPVLVNTGSEVVLFDTGNGAGGQPDVGNLVDRLRAAGYAPDQIDVVVITHFHGDHIGGLMTDGQPTFPNARYATGQVEYDWWTSDAPIGTDREGGVALVESNVVPLAENMTFLADGDDVVSGISAVAAFGHSPGHMTFNIESGGQRFFIFADVTNHYVVSMQKPEWHVSFDQDKDMAIESRKRILDMLVAERIPATGYHMPFPSVGFVEEFRDGYRWVPVSYQLHV